MVDVNPFEYVLPVPPERVIDREEEIAEISRLAMGHHTMRLDAPRRYGKTSLMRKLAAGSEDLTVLVVDLYGATSVGEIARAIARAIQRADLPQGAAVRAQSAIGALELSAQLGLPGVRIQAKKPGIDDREKLSRVLALLSDIADATGKPMLCMIDEFQQVYDIPGADALIRTEMQAQSNVTYLFAGSHPSLMAKLFGERDRPLYSQARALKLHPLPVDETAVAVSSWFQQTGREVGGDALQGLLFASRGHPQRTMLLAHFLWEHAKPGSVAGVEVWVEAYRAAMANIKPELEAMWDRTDISEQRTLKVIAVGSGKLEVQLLKTFGANRATAHSARRRLLDRGDIGEIDGASWIVDPLFEAFIRERIVGGEQFADEMSGNA